MQWAARRAALVACAAVLLAGCGVRGNGPEPLPLDRVDCARCGMLISSDANAAEAIVPGGGTRFYDDIGCMAGDPAAANAGVERFVRLADGTGWIPADAAYFAASAAVTPMAHGLVAFASEGGAVAADRDARPRRWDEVARMIGGR